MAFRILSFGRGLLAFVVAAVFTQVSSQLSGGLNLVDVDGVGSVDSEGAAGWPRDAFRTSYLRRLEEEKKEEEKKENSTKEEGNSTKEEGKEGEKEGKEGEEKEGEEGEEEEEEESIDETSLSAAAVLIGSVCFVMAVFYLVNNKDDNIRQCTWNLMSDTSSIFCAVLWYQAIDAWFDEAFENKDSDTWTRFGVGLAHFLLWYVSVQAVCICCFVSDRFGERTFEALTVLGSHLSGFAAKDVCNTLMQSKNFSESVGMSFVALLISILLLLVVGAIAYVIRQSFVKKLLGEEKYEDLGEEIREIENDMSALCIGFLISQVLRYAIHGKLPSEELDEKDYHKQWQAWLLFFCGGVFGLLAVGFVKLKFVHEIANQYIDRIVDNTKMTMVFTMSWCLLFWGQWEVFDAHAANRQVLARVILAVMLSAFSMILVFVIDYIADRLKSKFGKVSSRLLMYGFGLSLAFSWEQVFDYSIEEIAKGTKTFTEVHTKLMCAAALVSIVGPAWGLYILPKSLALEDVLEKAAKRAEKARKASKEKAMKLAEEEAKIGLQAGKPADQEPKVVDQEDQVAA